VKFEDSESAPSRALLGRDVRIGMDAVDAAKGADLVISAVTAGQAVEAASSARAGISAGTFYLDVNSIAPASRQAAAREVGATGGRYVEAAVMSPIGPKRIASPILLGGPHAVDFLPIARDLGFAGASAFSEELGRASAAKLCRSVMIKGMEALLAESLVAARAYGVEDAVLASLKDLMPGPDWPKLARYMISRSIEHGARRAEEMGEAARTVDDAHVDPHMCMATVSRQEWAAQFADALATETLGDMLDAIRALASARAVHVPSVSLRSTGPPQAGEQRRSANGDAA
jgi:3-hydroxyisobutyrate dehydrogenase-like beta-hydroxyacid dehydrogenase